MALVAMMHATEVKLLGGQRWIPCDPDEEGATEISGDHSAQWLRPDVTGKQHVRLEAGTRQEVFTLSALWDPDGPNRGWAIASPAGSLSLTVDNPGAMNYVKPGRHYRITIEEVRGPRKSDDEAV